MCDLSPRNECKLNRNYRAMVDFWLEQRFIVHRSTHYDLIVVFTLTIGKVSDIGLHLSNYMVISILYITICVCKREFECANVQCHIETNYLCIFDKYEKDMKDYSN